MTASSQAKSAAISGCSEICHPGQLPSLPLGRAAPAALKEGKIFDPKSVIAECLPIACTDPQFSGMLVKKIPFWGWGGKGEGRKYFSSRLFRGRRECGCLKLVTTWNVGGIPSKDGLVGRVQVHIKCHFPTTPQIIK